MHDPIERFREALSRARELEPFDATRCVLATADHRGRPSARFVLCKGADARGFSVYTNLESRKAQDLAENPWASLAFHWHTISIQVRVDGPIRPVPDDEADAYFATRPRESQIGAWASRQSRVIPSRDALDQAVMETAERFAGRDVPRPPYWGGYLVAPHVVEFWSAHEHRLHDRERYTRVEGGFDVERLSP